MTLEELIAEKRAAGLTREQAEEVAKAQLAHDEAQNPSPAAGKKSAKGGKENSGEDQ